MDQEQNNSIDDFSKTLNINLPNESYLPVKIIAYLTAIGGLSIVGSIFADIVRPMQISLFFYIFRGFVGFLMILVGYGILKRRGWAVWLYGGISFISLFVNSTLAILPICITLYLYMKKDLFTQVDAKSIIKEILIEINKIKLWLSKN